MSKAAVNFGAVVSRRDRGEPLTVTIDALTQDGRGVCRVAGKAVFVADSLPGETARVQPMRRRKGHDEARLLEIIDPSPGRVTPACDFFGLCGGCVLQHMHHDAQLAAKEEQLFSALLRIGKVEPMQLRKPVSARPWAYRRRARLGVRWVRAKQRVLVGFRERGGSYLADMQHCEVLVAGCRELPGLLAELIGGLSVKARLPQVEVTAADNGLALVFRVLDEPDKVDLQALTDFALRHDCRVYLQTGGLDSIRLLSGDDSPLYYEIDEKRIRIEFEPTDFIQINAELNDRMIDVAMEVLDLEPGERMLDLFCGLGNFSLPAARRGAQVTGIEGEPGLVARATANAQRNFEDEAGVIPPQFFVSNLFNDTADFPWARQRYDKVLLDPPRAGARAIVETISRFGPQRIVYVSCHPGTLARDAGILAEQGYTLGSAGILDMFPHTAHVESLAVFERQ